MEVGALASDPVPVAESRPAGPKVGTEARIPFFPLFDTSLPSSETISRYECWLWKPPKLPRVATKAASGSSKIHKPEKALGSKFVQVQLLPFPRKSQTSIGGGGLPVMNGSSPPKMKKEMLPAVGHNTSMLMLGGPTLSIEPKSTLSFVQDWRTSRVNVTFAVDFTTVPSISCCISPPSM